MNQDKNISGGLFWVCLGVLFLFFGNDIHKLVACLWIISLICLRIKVVNQWVVEKLKLGKSIRNREFYYITEKGQRTDLMSRRDLGKSISSVIICCLILIYLVLHLVSVVFSLNIARIIDVYKLIMGILILGAIIYRVRFYFNNIYYYTIPLISLVSLLKFLSWEQLSNVSTMMIFLCISSLLYAILTLVLPLYLIRKISNLSWLLGALMMPLVPIFLNYIPSNIMTGLYPKIYEFRDITIDVIEKDNLSSEIIAFLKSNPVVLEHLNGLRKVLNELIANMTLGRASSVLSIVTFLFIASYSLGKILFDLKLRLGEAKAKDIYEEIENQENVDYEDLRDCIFYGGEKYQDKIFSNREYKNTIISTEQGFEFYVEKRNWVIGISRFAQNVVGFLKKLI